MYNPTSNGKDVTVSGTHAFTWKKSRICCFMVKSCCVIDCTNRLWKNWGRSFYRLLKGKQNNMSRNNVMMSVFKEFFKTLNPFWFIHVSSSTSFFMALITKTNPEINWDKWLHSMGWPHTESPYATTPSLQGWGKCIWLSVSFSSVTPKCFGLSQIVKTMQRCPV